MKTTLLILISFFLLTSNISLSGQTYYTGFEDSIQQSSWVQHREGNTLMFNEWAVSWYGGSDSSYLAHYYPVGGTTPTDDWYISPPFDFSLGGSIDSLYHTFQGFGTPMSGDTIGIYLLNGSQDPSLATSKTLLQLYYDSIDYVVETNWQNPTWILETDIDIPMTTGTSYIAFRYKTIINWLDVKFDNLSISKNEPTPIKNEISENKLNIYPNPSNNLLNIEIEGKYELSIYNYMGKIVYESKGMENQSLINTSLYTKGLYYVSLSNENNKIVKSFIKN